MMSVEDAMRSLDFCIVMESWTALRQTGRKAQLRAGVYARLSETYDAAESVPTQLERGTDLATRRGWMVVAILKDDGYSGFKQITSDGFGELIAAIEAGQVDVVIVRDIDRLTRNLADWNAFEKACVRHGVWLSAYTGGDLDLSTPEGPMRRDGDAASVAGKRGQERAGPGGPGPEGAEGSADGRGERWFGYTRVYANPDEPNPKKRHIVRESSAWPGGSRRVLDVHRHGGRVVAIVGRGWCRLASLSW